MLSDLSEKWANRKSLITPATGRSIRNECAYDLTQELAATHERMEQRFRDFRMVIGFAIRKSGHDLYEQLEQDILKELK